MPVKKRKLIPPNSPDNPDSNKPRKLRIDGQPDRRGGFRPGAGRPKGALTRMQRFSLEYYRQRFPVQPLDHFLSILNGEPQLVEVERVRNRKKVLVKELRKPSKTDRMEAAKAAAPYLHQRLTAVELSATTEMQHKIDVTKLTDEELDALESICIKALVPTQVFEDGEHEEDITVDYTVVNESDQQ